MPAFIVQLAFALVLAFASYYIQARRMKSPQPTQMKPQSISQPTVDAGRPIPVVFGRVRVKSPNLLWMGGQNTTPIKK